MNTLTVPNSVADRFENTAQNYLGPSQEEVPVWTYVGLLMVYSATLVGLETATRKFARHKKKSLQAADFLLFSVAAYKVARVVTMDFITAPLRAPFTERGHDLGGGEIQDHSRGHGLQRAIGNLLTCPYCFTIWAATAFVYSFKFAPRTTRSFASIMAVSTGADILNHAHRFLRENVKS